MSVGGGAYIEVITGMILSKALLGKSFLSIIINKDEHQTGLGKILCVHLY